MIDTMFATETMAELSARQGRLADAIALYRHLIAGAEAKGDGGPTDSARLEKWKARCAELEAGGHTGPSALATATSRERATPARAEVAEASGQLPSLVVHETVRSGQVIYAEGRDLIVVASVNSGAQLLADGNIHIYGALRGRAVAGAHGQRDAQVFCLAVQAELVGVDTGYLLSDDIPPAYWGAPARISLTPEGICTVTALSVGKPVGPAGPAAPKS
jgi:septum formation inhibitor MinC